MPTAGERLLADVREGVIETSVAPVAATVTIGGILVPRHARDVHEALTRTQETLDSAKRKHPGSFLAYRPNIEQEALRRENVRATDEIVGALNERRILSTFEPIVDTVTRRPRMYECLIRIRRTDGGLTPASDVVPVAERLGLARLLDQRMLELAIAELSAHPELCLSLNVSPQSIIDPDWWTGLEAQSRAHAGSAGRLTLEITETAEIQDIDEARGFVRRARDLGCRVAIDDFGAGYTSFHNMRKLGVDIIKIDGSFVENLTRSPDDAAFVRTLLDLAHALGATTVAERVQNEAAAVCYRTGAATACKGN
jgi:EAL domain-containing protein (putative c-di-GMP-specific phosphodiesterase class I)